jgi:hypothetical protein
VGVAGREGSVFSVLGMQDRSIRKSFTSLVHAALLLLAIAVAGTGALAQQPENTSLPFARGEQLFYQAELNRGLLRGMDVGELRFSARVSADGNARSAATPVVSMIGDAVTRGFLIRLTGSKFHLHVESVADPSPFAVLHTKSLYEDRRTTINSEGVFDHAAGKLVWTKVEQNQKPSATTLPFTGPIQDVLTLIYFVRTQNLKPGQSFDVAMVDAGHTYRCSVNVVAGKKMSTAVGRVNTVRVEPAIFDDNREVRSRGTLSIWLTDDARHIPVKAQVKAPIGTIDIKLKRIRYGDADIAQK